MRKKRCKKKLACTPDEYKRLFCYYFGYVDIDAKELIKMPIRSLLGVKRNEK